MKTVTVAAFNSPAEAEPLKSRLAAAGIQAEIHSESKLGETLDFSRPRAGVRIEVPRDDFERALRMVYDWNVASNPEGVASQGVNRGSTEGGAPRQNDTWRPA